jgi:DNA-binding CsgD family transcriptional regulator
MHISDHDFQRVSGLWRDLADIPAAEPDVAMRHCLAGAATLIGAQNVAWVGATRQPGPPGDDPMAGWRPQAVEWLHPTPHMEKLYAELLSKIALRDADPHTTAMARRHGQTRAHLRDDLVEGAHWRNSWLYNEVWRPSGLSDEITSAYSVDAQHESYLVIDRGSGDAAFSARERDLLLLFLQGSGTFHREIMRARGLWDRSERLGASEKEVLRLLLTDRSEKEIAAECGLTPATVHQYAVGLYRKFGVRGRVGLMAYWLRFPERPPTDP